MKNILLLPALIMITFFIIGSEKNNEPRVEKSSDGRYKLIINCNASDGNGIS